MIKKMKTKFFVVLVAALLIASSLSTIITAQANISEESSKAVIILDAPFSTDGAAREIIRSYGSIISVPTASATIRGNDTTVTTVVRYLASNGWKELSLPTNRMFTIGNVSAPDKNRTAIYEVVYSAGEGDSKTELVYTIYAGLEMFLTTLQELTVFVGDEFLLPECRPSYRYKDDSNAFKYIDIEAGREILFYPNDIDSAPIVVTPSLNKLTPSKEGVYKLVFTSPDEIKSDDEVFVKGSISREITVRVIKQRSNPISGANGTFQTGYFVGGTSEMGVGMVRSSCDPNIQIEKRNSKFLLYFTVTAAHFIDGLFVSQNGISITGAKLYEEYVGADLVSVFVFILSANQLENELSVGMHVIPMEKDISFSILADLENAYYLTDTLYDLPDEIAILLVDEQPPKQSNFWLYFFISVAALALSLVLFILIKKGVIFNKRGRNNV